MLVGGLAIITCARRTLQLSRKFGDLGIIDLPFWDLPGPIKLGLFLLHERSAQMNADMWKALR